MTERLWHLTDREGVAPGRLGLEEGIDAQGGIERLARQSCPLHLPAAIASGASSAAAWASTEETILQRCFLMYPHARERENNACMICSRLKW